MRNTIIVTASLLACFGLITGGCRKNKEAERLFADRHWHRTITTTTTCYDLATQQQQLSKNTTVSEFDTVFALKKLEDGGIDFIGWHLSPYHTGDTDQYIHSNGHGSNSAGFSLLYAKGTNVIYATLYSEAIIMDATQQTSCKGESKTHWSSSN